MDKILFCEDCRKIMKYSQDKHHIDCEGSLQEVSKHDVSCDLLVYTEPCKPHPDAKSLLFVDGEQITGDVIAYSIPDDFVTTLCEEYEKGHHIVKNCPEREDKDDIDPYKACMKSYTGEVTLKLTVGFAEYFPEVCGSDDLPEEVPF